MPARSYWLMKSEPDVYSIKDLERDGSTPWEGVRNYQARNFMRVMRKGDWVLFYHSNAKPSGIAGLARVSRTAYPDPTQFDSSGGYFDAKATKEAPRWDLVDVEHMESFEAVLPLATLKAEPALKGMHVVQRGSRLSVTPVEKTHFKRALRMARATARLR